MNLIVCKLYLKKLLRINWKIKVKPGDQLGGYYIIQTVALKSLSSEVGIDIRNTEKNKYGWKMLWKVNELRNSDLKGSLEAIWSDEGISLVIASRSHFYLNTSRDKELNIIQLIPILSNSPHVK